MRTSEPGAEKLSRAAARATSRDRQLERVDRECAGLIEADERAAGPDKRVELANALFAESAGVPGGTAVR